MLLTAVFFLSLSHTHTHTRTYMPFYRFVSILFVFYVILSSTNCGLIDLIGVKEEHAWCKLKRHFRKLLSMCGMQGGCSLVRLIE